MQETITRGRRRWRERFLRAPQGIGLPIDRCDDHRSWKPVAEAHQQAHLALFVDVGVPRHPLPEPALRQEVGEPGRQPQRGGHASAGLILEEQSQDGPVRVIPVTLLPFQPGVVTPSVEVGDGVSG